GGLAELESGLLALAWHKWDFITTTKGLAGQACLVRPANVLKPNGDRAVVARHADTCDWKSLSHPTCGLHRRSRGGRSARPVDRGTRVLSGQGEAQTRAGRQEPPGQLGK